MTENATISLSVRSLLEELSADPGTKELGERLADVLDVDKALTKSEAKRSEALDREWRAAKEKHLMAKVMENAVNDVICDYEMRLAEDEEASENLSGKTISTEERQVRAQLLIAQRIVAKYDITISAHAKVPRSILQS